jgi:5-methyltetrahydropteroyltriglutamate--homocysteine methyltransferase
MSMGAQRNSLLIHNSEVKNRVASIGHDDDKRQSDFGYRKQIQKEALNLPLSPTTTIGSFAQTFGLQMCEAAFNLWRCIATETYDRALGILRTIVD